MREPDPAGRPTGASRPRVVALGVLLALAAGAAVTAGLWRDVGGRMVAGNIPDAIHYSWWLGHTPDAIGDGRTPFLTRAMNWPEGVSTMNNTTLLLPAVLLAPLTVLAGPLTTLNVLNTLAVPLCAVAGYWSARAVGARRAGAVAGALAFALSPAIVNSLVGHVTMALAPALPVLVALSVQAWRGAPDDRRPLHTGLLLGLVATVQVFTGEEVLFQAGIGALLVLVTAAVSRPRAIAAGAKRLLTALAAAFAVFLPLAGYPLYLQFFGPLTHEGSPFLKDYYGADLTAFTTPTDRVLLHTERAAAAAERFPGGIEEHLAYLGWPLVVTCLVVAVLRWRDLRVRCAAVAGFVAAALSLGGRVWIDGTWTEIAGPYRLLQELPVTEASLASRLGLLVAVFAGALLAFAVDAVRHGSRAARVRPVAAAVLAVACIVPLVPRPLPTVAAPEVPAFFAAADRHVRDGEVLVVLPYPVPADPVAMRWQSEAGYRFRMPGGYFLGPAADGQAYVGGAADPATARLLADVARTGLPYPVTPVEQAQAAADLAHWQADRVVLGPAPHHDALRTTMTALIGREPRAEAGVLVWEVTP